MLLASAALVGCAPITPGYTQPSGTPAAVSPPESVTALEQTVTQVIQATQPSVVEVQSQGSRGGAVGSGVVVRQDGYILTNDHVVRGFQTYRVLFADGRALSARLVGEAPGDDLAVLKVDATSLRPIPIGDSADVVVGEFVLALGSPLGLEQSVTFGIVSAVNRSANGGSGVLTGLIQTSAPINPGNSGGALVNMRGELVGIPTLGAATSQGQAANGIGFAIASNRAKFVLDQLIANGRLVNTGQGFLGITGTDVTPQLAADYNLAVQRGVLVTGFTADASGQSPAQRAGLQQRDIITRVNSTAIEGNADLASVLLAQSPGSRVQLTLQRGSNQQQVTVTLGERPASPTG
jgi:S1-C subfamily serine protease